MEEKDCDNKKCEFNKDRMCCNMLLTQINKCYQRIIVTEFISEDGI